MPSIRRMSMDCNCNVFKMQIFALSALLQTLNTEYQHKRCNAQDALGYLCSLFQWKLHFMRTWLFALPAHWFTVTDMEFVKKFRDCSFWAKKIHQKTYTSQHLLICHKSAFKLFDMGLNQWKALVFFLNFTDYFSISTHILSWNTQKVRKILRKYIKFRFVLWKNYDTRKNFTRPWLGFKCNCLLWFLCDRLKKGN